MSLRQRLIVQLLAVFAVSVFFAASVLYWRAAHKVSTELHAALKVGEQLLLDAIKEIERSNSPYQQVRLVIERFSGGRHLKIALIDKNGSRIAESRLAQPDDPAPDWFYSALGGSPKTARIGLPENVQGYTAFSLETDARNEVQEFWEDAGYGLFVVSILSSLAGLLIYWTVGRELRPLQDLNRALLDVADGNFTSRLAASGSTDLQAVVRGFNEMTERLETAETTKTALETQLAAVQEEERAELARDLHDEIGPLLFSAGITAAEVQANFSNLEQSEVLEQMQTIRDSVKLSQQHVLQLLGRLRTGTVEDLGLEGAINGVVEFWIARHPHITITTDVPADGVSLDLDPVIYRIVQESVSNAVRHGRPSQIEVSVTVDSEGTAHVAVSDNGAGLQSARPGHGLRGMRERAESRNGTFSIRSTEQGSGTVVAVQFPARALSHVPIIATSQTGLHS